jgi:hypothetical protein
MTPKEKAEELVDRYERYSNPYYYGPLVNFGPHFSEEERRKGAKSCALIAVDEIINSRNDDRGFDDTLSSVSSEYYTVHPMYLTYWQEVKQEIEKL